MIYDAIVPVGCDGEGCTTNVSVQPDFVYPNYSGKGGAYDTSDSAIEGKLADEGWLMQDGKHYCCAECAPVAGRAVGAS